MGQDLLIDATSIFAFQQYLKQQDYPVQGNINYGALLDALRGSKSIRINQLASELGISSQAIIAKLHTDGPGESALNHMTRISPGAAQSIREWSTALNARHTGAPGAATGPRPRSVSGSGSRAHSVSGSDTVSRNLNSSTPFDVMFAFVAINPEHEGQQKFCAFLRGQGFTVDETDFRDAFIIPNREYPYQRLSTRLAYIAGMLAAPYDKEGKPRQLPHLLVVTDAFDVYYPLLDYVQNRNGQVTIAFFKRGMEERWQRAGLFDEDSPIKFRDLSDDAQSIIGADLSSSVGTKEGGKGLADFRL